MKQKSSAKFIVVMAVFVLTVALAVLAIEPFLSEILAVEVVQPDAAVMVTQAPLPEAPEELCVTSIYVMEENTKKITDIYIEVFHVGSDTVCYVNVPVDTKVNLSEDLYKSLQTYAPELPQYLKLSNMAEGFSKEYGLTGCNRILSEVLGTSLKEYVGTDKESLTAWLEALKQEKTEVSFFEDYTSWLLHTSSSRSIEERWMYYESLWQVNSITTEIAPGSKEKDGYLISGKRSAELLQELMLRVETEE